MGTRPSNSLNGQPRDFPVAKYGPNYHPEFFGGVPRSLTESRCGASSPLKIYFGLDSKPVLVCYTRTYNARGEETNWWMKTRNSAKKRKRCETGGPKASSRLEGSRLSSDSTRLHPSDFSATSSDYSWGFRRRGSHDRLYKNEKKDLLNVFDGLEDLGGAESMVGSSTHSQFKIGNQSLTFDSSDCESVHSGRLNTPTAAGAGMDITESIFGSSLLRSLPSKFDSEQAAEEEKQTSEHSDIQKPAVNKVELKSLNPRSEKPDFKPKYKTKNTSGAGARAARAKGGGTSKNKMDNRLSTSVPKALGKRDRSGDGGKHRASLGKRGGLKNRVAKESKAVMDRRVRKSTRLKKQHFAVEIDRVGRVLSSSTTTGSDSNSKSSGSLSGSGWNKRPRRSKRASFKAKEAAASRSPRSRGVKGKFDFHSIDLVTKKADKKANDEAVRAALKMTKEAARMKSDIRRSKTKLNGPRTGVSTQAKSPKGTGVGRTTGKNDSEGRAAVEEAKIERERVKIGKERSRQNEEKERKEKVKREEEKRLLQAAVEASEREVLEELKKFRELDKQEGPRCWFCGESKRLVRPGKLLRRVTKSMSMEARVCWRHTEPLNDTWPDLVKLNSLTEIPESLRAMAKETYSASNPMWTVATKVTTRKGAKKARQFVPQEVEYFDGPRLSCLVN
ncbi:hypothetical protein AAMO2058_000414600 [Amorphochlora amoebiformis]